VVAPPLGLLDIAGQVLLEADSTAVCEFVVLAFLAVANNPLQVLFRKTLRVLDWSNVDLKFHINAIFAKIEKIICNKKLCRPLSLQEREGHFERLPDVI